MEKWENAVNRECNDSRDAEERLPHNKQTVY